MLGMLQNSKFPNRAVKALHVKKGFLEALLNSNSLSFQYAHCSVSNYVLQVLSVLTDFMQIVNNETSLANELAKQVSLVKFLYQTDKIRNIPWLQWPQQINCEDI